jgi:hypothetical protein
LEIDKYKNIKSKFQLDFKKNASKSEKLTDADIILFDTINNALIVSELKNLRWADSINEHINVQGIDEDDGLNKAYAQIELVHNYYENNTG